MIAKVGDILISTCNEKDLASGDLITITQVVGNHMTDTTVIKGLRNGYPWRESAHTYLWNHCFKMHKTYEETIVFTQEELASAESFPSVHDLEKFMRLK